VNSCRTGRFEESEKSFLGEMTRKYLKSGCVRERRWGFLEERLKLMSCGDDNREKIDILKVRRGEQTDEQI
jgi:hypothetical protein